MTPEHKAAIAEGKRKAREARSAMQESGAEAGEVVHGGTATVIYRPLEGDPHTTVWNGVKFHANIPVELGAGHVVKVPRTRLVLVEGIMRPKEYEENVPMVEIAKGNPSFEVNGVRAMKLVNKRILPPAGHGWAEDHEDQISNAW